MYIDIQKIRSDRRDALISKHGALGGNRTRRLGVTITEGNPPLVFIITSYQDFLVAIADSWLDSPVYSTYQLQTNLTFDADHVPYLRNGDDDTDFLYIRPGQTFDGKGFTMTLVHGCEPVNSWTDDGYLPSIIIYAGDFSSTTPAIIQNVSIVVEQDMQFTYLLSYECSHAIFRNITIVSHASTFSYTLFMFDYGQNITMDSISIVSTQPLSSSNYIGFIGFMDGTENTLTNSFFVASSIDQYTYLIGGNNTNGSAFVASNVYCYLSSQSAIVTGVAGIFYGNSNSDNTTTLKNVYVIYNTYSDVQSLNIPIVYYNYVSAILNYENVYTNNDSGIVNGNMTTRFTWSSQPTFSAPNGFDTSSPNRLLVFTYFPFNAYPSFGNPVAMMQSITSIPDARVSTIEGNVAFLYRMTNPIEYAPQSKVITNEYILRRDLHGNFIPSRNGFVAV